jgi:predicted dehydrogenase
MYCLLEESTVKQVLLKRGQPFIEDVPAPAVEAGTVLVRVHFSCISAGTEVSVIQSSGTPLYRRALKQPENVRKVLRLLATQGLSRTLDQVRGKLDAAHAIGYSAAGVVLESGDGISDLHIGDRVACAGAQCAHHAEVIRVPRNLAVRAPDKVDLEAASTVALGAIALQGVRRAQPTLGETFVVVGLGVIGQLTAQLLRANGCRVIGTDLDPDRTRLALELGIDSSPDPENGSDLDHVLSCTDGLGADGVIITAATPSHDVVSSAFQMCRKKGRVVLVGDVGLNLKREDFYSKELDFFISTSYGPGRYDARYEEKGVDYPPGYVRWTENRNMAEYLRLIQLGRIQVKPLMGQPFPVTEAGAAYASLQNSHPRPLIVLLAYPQEVDTAPSRSVPNVRSRPTGINRIRIAVVGAGSFAKGTHLPNLKRLSSHYHLQAVMSRTGYTAVALAREFGAGYATTDYAQVVADPEVDAILLATRHHQHASLTLEALRAGKHVLVEKPLCLTREELDAVREFHSSAKAVAPVLLTGFNRRFSPHIRRIRELTGKRNGPMIMNYRMNAGCLPPDHWVFSADGGGRNIGEACHTYDLLTHLTESAVVRIDAQCLRPSGGLYQSGDNFVVMLTFADGSVGNVLYTSLGSVAYPKEHFELFVDGKVIQLEDFRRLTIYGGKAKGLSTKRSEKGHFEELEAFAQSVRTGEWSIPLWQQIQATAISFEIENLLRDAGCGGKVGTIPLYRDSQSCVA